LGEYFPKNSVWVVFCLGVCKKHEARETKADFKFFDNDIENFFRKEEEWASRSPIVRCLKMIKNGERQDDKWRWIVSGGVEGLNWIRNGLKGKGIWPPLHWSI
jgi:hypothetical protein